MGSMIGKVAVVTGASRGGGLGIASVPGEAGTTVYVTGRSVRGSLTNPRGPVSHCGCEPDEPFYPGEV
jgi:NAD(P)-dependent dehydrogenase (short-subunit alcohol dehydrogenase family)